MGLGSIPGVVEERLKVFRYLVQEKPSGTFGEVKFWESMRWVLERELVFSIGVDTRSGRLWQLEEAIKAIQEVVKDSEGVGGVGAFVVSQFASSFPHTAKSNYVNPLPPPCL